MTDWKTIAREFGFGGIFYNADIGQLRMYPEDCIQRMAEEIVRLRKELSRSMELEGIAVRKTQSAYVSCARLRAALGEIAHRQSSHMPGWKGTWVYKIASRALTTTDGKAELEAVKEVIDDLKKGTEKSGVFWREIAVQKLSDAFGLNE